MGNLNSNIMIRLMADTSNYSTKMQAASMNAEKLAVAVEKPVTTGQKLGMVASNVALGMGALTTAIGVSAVNSFAEFDQAMSAVQVDTGATGDELTALKDKAIEAGARTVYDAKQCADAIDELAKAGMSTTDILNGGLDGALDLAASGQMGVADAAEIAASTLAQFNLAGNQATHVADLLAAGANAAMGGVGDMGEALGMVGTTANQLGMSVDDTVGALTMLAKQGIVGSEAGTQLRSALIGLTSASGPVQKEMDALGISLYDSQGQFVGLANFAGQLRGALQDLTPEERANAMGILFSNAAMNAGNILYAEGKDGVESYTKAVQRNGYASQQAAALTDNLKGDMEQLSGAFESASIKIGEGANGPLRKIVQTATDVVDAFGDLPAGVQQGIIAFGMLTGAAAGIHKIFSSTAMQSSKLGTAIGNIVDPIGNVQRAIPKFKEGFGDLAAVLSTSWQSLSSGTPVIGQSTVALSGLKNIGSGLITMMGGPWGIALTAGTALLVSFAQEHEAAKQRVEQLTDAMQSGTSAVEYYTSAFNDGSSSRYTDGFFNKLKNGYDTVWDAVDKVGIKHATYIKAIQGDQESYNKIQKAVNDYTSSLNVWDQWWDSSGNTTLEALAEGQDNYKKATETSTETQKQATQAELEKTSALLNGTNATKQAADANQDAADSDTILSEKLEASTKGINEQAEALASVIDALETYYGFNLSESDALIKLHEDYDKCSESIKKNGATLDLNTDKGRDNQSVLNDLAKAAYDAAKAQAENGKSVDEVGATMDDARAKLTDYAQKMGMSSEEANQFADSVGISRQAVEDLVKNVADANGTNADMNIIVTDQASKTLDSVKLKAENIKGKKEVKITGNNDDAMKAISEVTGVKIDPKTGQLTLNADQYNIALALANGAKIDPKTGVLLGENNDYWQKIASANGWRIDPKTGEISGDNGKFMAAKQAVENTTIKGKKVSVDADASGFWGTVNGILGKVFSVKVSADSGHASGGYITGPGTGTSDSIHAWLSNGEYVVRAEAVKALGRGFFDQINYRRYASGGYVAATPVPENTRKIEKTRVTGNPNITVNVTGSKDPEIVARETVEIIRREMGVR
ncbi:phage tail tape measure protein [Bifidobacterium dentium]|uniref:phage tail tape measure protein n=1 Tax=Bifidobacterium dentium TaxID=1689 RepID=UPI0018C2C8C4|nr:phage tail tape measure protein [Bifidobacterium dentium]